MSYQIDALPNFKKELKRLAKKHASLTDDFTALLKTLPDAPTQGASIGHNRYKIRLAIGSKAKGKSGGACVITCVVFLAQRITLLSI